jgi:cysteine desulfurase family protein (TIGR01976 family)
MKLDVAALRAQFPALQCSSLFLDGPAGSQVPQSVIDAISHYYIRHNANHGGCFRTSRDSDAMMDEVRRACADLLNAPDDQCIAFGANMTTLTFSLSRAISTEWQPGDEVIVTQLDHDANVTPWVRAAQDRGAIVKRVAIRPEDCTLDLDDFKAKLSARTKVVAVGCVSNAVGTRNPFPEMIRLSHEVGAKVFLDAVHHAPHLPIDVAAWDCDFLCCSAYKFFGPHVGILYGKRQWLESLPSYKVRPAPESLPDRWMTGTQNFAAIAGVGAAIDYLASIGKSLGANGTRRELLLNAFTEIENHERELSREFLNSVRELKSYRVFGIVDHDDTRVSTFGLTHRTLASARLSELLASKEVFSWSGNFYALSLTEALALEPQGMLRLGFLHYNTREEVTRVVEALRDIDRA